MALAELDTRRQGSSEAHGEGNRIVVSAAAELFWGIRALHRMELGVPEHLELDRPRSRRLAERVRQFWGDGVQCYTEIFVLAARGGHLDDDNADAMLSHLPDLCALPLEPRMLDTEDPPDRTRIAERLRRLAADARLRAGYARLLETVWAAQTPAWRREGRALVRRTAASWQQQLDRGASPIAAAFVSESAGCSGELVGMARDAAAAGRLLVAPTFFGTGFCIVDAGPMTIMSAPGAGNADPLRALREAARGVAARGKVLADPTRMAICSLLQAEPLTVGEVARRLDLSQPTVSAHFALLRNAELVQEQRQGRTTRYRLDAGRVEAMLGELRDLVLNRQR